MKNTKALLISLGMAIIALLLVFSYVSRQEQRILQGSTMINVVTAAKDIAAGTRLDESNLLSRHRLQLACDLPGAASLRCC